MDSFAVIYWNPLHSLNCQLFLKELLRYSLKLRFTCCWISCPSCISHLSYYTGKLRVNLKCQNCTLTVHILKWYYLIFTSIRLSHKSVKKPLHFTYILQFVYQSAAMSIYQSSFQPFCFSNQTVQDDTQIFHYNFQYFFRSADLYWHCYRHRLIVF